jgi:glycosyltransferase involved in cell wall biosynthesis
VVLFYHYVAHLLDAGYEVCHLLLLENGPIDDIGIEGYRKRVSRHGKISIIAPPATGRLITRAKGGFQFDQTVAEEGLRQASEFGADILFALDLAAYWAVARLKFPFRAVWLGDLNFQTRWYHAVCLAKEQPLKVLKLPSAWKHSRLWRKAYREVLVTADQIVVSSGASVGELDKLGLDSEYHPYPWPCPSVAVTSSAKTGKKPTFLFCGGLNALGSKSALLFILRKLYPQMRKIWGAAGFKLIIAGRGEPAEVVRSEMEQCREIDFRGFVENLNAVFDECHGLIVPIDIPVGNRSRIVTALANGWLVIAHSFTQAGNPDLRDGVNCYLADDASGFVRRMKEAFEDPASADQIRANAQALYQEKFAPERAVSRLLKAIPPPSE